MKLHEFVKIYEDEYQLTTPSCLQPELNNTKVDADGQIDTEKASPPSKAWIKKNLFPEFSETDLSFLFGHAVIIPHTHLRVHERGQAFGEAASTGNYDVIKALTPYDLSFMDCEDSPQKRLERLFTIKDKWTLQEIQAQVGMFVEPAQVAKFDAWVGKFTRSCKEKNPFNVKIVTQFFTKKF